MEQMMESLLVEMRRIWEMVEASNEKMKACLENLEKTRSLVREDGGQDRDQPGITIDLEEMMVMESEANQGKIGAKVEHQDIPNKKAAVETIRALEDQSGDQRLTIGY
jgi:CRISPR/Cas system-associated exonuclease Cas4 (RecB family)